MKPDTLIQLARKNCKDLKIPPQALSAPDIEMQLHDFPGWKQDGGQIAKKFCFNNYYEAMAFANATAWISHRQDHHPDMKLGYNTVEITYSTHSSGGITEFDLICAAKIEQLFTL